MSNKQFLLALVVLLVAGLAGGALINAAQGNAQAAGSKVLKVQKLALVDKAGKTRAVLGTGADGSVAFQMLDAAGKAQVKLFLDHNAGYLELGREKGKGQVVLTSEGMIYARSPQGTGVLYGPAVSLRNQAKARRADLDVAVHQSVLAMFDENGKVLWQAPATCK